MFDKIRPFFTTPPRRPTSQLGAGMSDEDEPAIPAFQQAWKQGATFEDMFGPNPFTLHGSVGRSGADNHRPDVAKVETFLGDAGYYKPLTNDGPSGWHNANLDSAIRSFQKDKGLEVDGLLKPNGPTIGKIAETALGFWEGVNNDHRDVLELPSSPRPPKPPMDAPDLPDGDIWEKPQPTVSGHDDLEALIRIMNGGQKPEPTGTPPYRPTPPRLPPITQRPHDGGITHPIPTLPDRFPGHTISESGAKEHDDWAKLLVKDSDPSQTARMLTVAIKEYGNQGRGDVADLLGRFHKIDPAKAETLRRAVRDATGEDLPFRVAPRGEGFRELTDEEKLARAPKSPFGSAQGADRWAAGNMAEALLGQGDYADAVKHFRTDKSATMPYLAAVHGIMADKNPMQAMKFAKKMNEAGLTEAPEKKAEETTPYPVPIPPAPVPVPAPAPAPEQPKPLPEPDRKPETTEGTETTPPGLGGAVGTSAGQTAMPTASKEGGIAGGGKSGKVTSPASVILRDATGGARAKALRPITGTTSVGGSVARAIPFFGAFATFLDFLNYMNSQEPPPPSI